MGVIVIIVLLVFSFLWNWLILWIGAKIIGSKEGSLKNCAILIGINYAVIGVVLGFLAFGDLFNSLIFGLLCLAVTAGAMWLLFNITMSILDISFWNCVALCVVTWGLNWFGSFLLGKLGSILPGMVVVAVCGLG